MRPRTREAIAPLYLLCCLLLGSAQNSWALMVLQLLGLALLAWAALEPASEPLGRAARQPLMIAGLALVVIALQLVPLPPSLWQHLGGRQGLATDYRILGLHVPALPLSLTPYETLDDVLKLVPPMAMACAIVRLRAYRPTWLAAALVAGTAASIVFGAIHPSSGVFASPILSTASHAAILSAIALPFAVALFVLERGRWRLLVACALLAVAAAFVSIAAIRQQVPVHGASVEGRSEVLRTAARATVDFMPFGSGLGSFQNVYRLYENPDRVTADEVIHAHNDYLEIALEMGLPGILLLVGFLSWWIVVLVRVWRETDAAPFTRAASFASALVLVDSLVDCPLRTAAVSVVFAMCVALLADRRLRSRSELRPVRHVVLQ